VLNRLFVPSRPRTIVIALASIVLLFLAATLPFWLWPLDLQIQRLFFDPAGVESPWVGKQNALFDLLYAYGCWPAYAMAGVSGAIFLLGFRVPSWSRWRRTCAYLVLCLAIGPGLIVNCTLKSHWGRPRPRQVQEFGGEHAFVRVWAYDASSGGSSFPSGHASTGFYFLALTPLLWRRRQAVAAAALGLGFGSTIGVARMAQGGHFASDVLWSAGICALTSAGLFFALRLDQAAPSRGAAESTEVLPRTEPRTEKHAA